MENEKVSLGDKFKNWFSKYKLEIVEAYIVAAVFFSCMSMGMEWIIAAVFVGIANTYFVTPVVNALSPHVIEGERELFDIGIKTFTINLFRSLFICSFIMVIYYFIDLYLFTTYVEPITFGIVYEFINIGLRKLTRKLTRNKQPKS